MDDELRSALSAIDDRLSAIGDRLSAIEGQQELTDQSMQAGFERSERSLGRVRADVMDRIDRTQDRANAIIETQAAHSDLLSSLLERQRLRDQQLDLLQEAFRMGLRAESEQVHNLQ